MGKKSGSGTDGGDAPMATSFVLKVPTHCQCDGCGDKIRAAVKDLALWCEGIVSLDQSALGTKGELAVVATADPERLRRRLRKATGKSVDLVFPKPATAKDAVQALLLAGLQQQQAVHGHHVQPMPAAAWNAIQPGGYAQAAYPYPWWVVQQQQQAKPEPYLASYPAAYANAYPHDGLGGGWYGTDY